MLETRTLSGSSQPGMHGLFAILHWATPLQKRRSLYTHLLLVGSLDLPENDTTLGSIYQLVPTKGFLLLVVNSIR